MGTALLVEYYNELTRLSENAPPPVQGVRFQKAMERFKRQVAARYSEGTLQRLLDAPVAGARRAAVLALGLLGSMASNPAVAARLHDDDGLTRRLAADSLWAIWFRAGGDPQNLELQRLVQLRDPTKALAGLDALTQTAPEYAEAYNQRAILFFRLKEYKKSATDCRKVIELNPYHFGAYSGLGQCYLNVKKPRQALKAFRQALEINPNLDGIANTIRALENTLGE